MWARIDNGLVVETTDLDPAGRFHPALAWGACDATVRQGYAAALVDGSTFRGETSVWTYAAPPPAPAPLPAQLAAIAIGAGLAITSAGTPALNGTYACDTAAQSHLSAEMIALLNSGGAAFADGGATVAWPDLAGTVHTFTPAAFKAFALAVGAYVAALFKVMNGTLSSLPPTISTIP